jgi:hypothetical protein
MVRHRRRLLSSGSTATMRNDLPRLDHHPPPDRAAGSDPGTKIDRASVSFQIRRRAPMDAGLAVRELWK